MTSPRVVYADRGDGAALYAPISGRRYAPPCGGIAAAAAAAAAAVGWAGVVGGVGGRKGVAEKTTENAREREREREQGLVIGPFD